MFGPLQWRSRNNIYHDGPGTEPTVSSDSVDELEFTARFSSWDLNSWDTFLRLSSHDDPDNLLLNVCIKQLFIRRW